MFGRTCPLVLGLAAGLATALLFASPPVLIETVAGLALLGISSPFWGLVAGLAFLGAHRVARSGRLSRSAVSSSPG